MELMELINSRFDIIEEKIGETASDIDDLNSDLSDLAFYGGTEKRLKFYGIDK